MLFVCMTATTLKTWHQYHFIAFQNTENIHDDKTAPSPSGLLSILGHPVKVRILAEAVWQVTRVVKGVRYDL